MFKCSNVLNPPITTYPNPPQNTVGKKAPKMRQAPLQASQLLNNDIPQPTSKHSGQKISQNESSSLTSSPTPQLPHTPIHLKTQWAKRFPKTQEFPYKRPDPLITIYHNPPEITVGKKAPKMRRAPLQASQPLYYDIPQPTSKQSGQKGSQNEMSSLKSSLTPQLPHNPIHLKT